MKRDAIERVIRESREQAMREMVATDPALAQAIATKELEKYKDR